MTQRNPEYGDPLVERELEVLSLMATGLSNRQIGRLLFLSEQTVKTHAHRVFLKLAVQDRTNAVVVAFRMGLVACPCRTWDEFPAVAS